MPRLFVAAWPSPEVIERLRALPRPEESRVRWVPPERWHVTLRFLGEADEAAAALVLASMVARPATAVLGLRVSRLGRSVDLACRVPGRAGPAYETVERVPLSG